VCAVCEFVAPLSLHYLLADYFFAYISDLTKQRHDTSTYTSQSNHHQGAGCCASSLFPLPPFSAGTNLGIILTITLNSGLAALRSAPYHSPPEHLPLFLCSAPSFSEAPAALPTPSDFLSPGSSATASCAHKLRTSVCLPHSSTGQTRSAYAYILSHGAHPPRTSSSTCEGTLCGFCTGTAPPFSLSRWGLERTQVQEPPLPLRVMSCDCLLCTVCLSCPFYKNFA